MDHFLYQGMHLPVPGTVLFVVHAVFQITQYMCKAFLVAGSILIKGYIMIVDQCSPPFLPPLWELYQNANISITGFENTTYPDNFFDVVVGNVPFGDYKVFDPKYNKYNFRIHDYFLAKALDQVRPGGMVAVITTKGTLDKANPTIRKYLAERAELVGAVRLPNTAFKDNAGTEVTADILFLQKRERKIDIEPDWVHLGVTENGIAVNSYFAEHPEMMLGSMEYDTRIYGQDSRYTVCVNNDENFNMYEALNKAIGNIKAQMTDFEGGGGGRRGRKVIVPVDELGTTLTHFMKESSITGKILRW